MVEGQQRDMDGEHRQLGEAEVLELMRCKTGALLAASVAGGALCAGAEAAAAYPTGLKLGLAFQIADDLLDLTADTATLGKRAGKDAGAGKSTLPSLLGQEAARRRAEALLGEALAALAPLGPQAEPLRALARYVIDRKK
jgi:farnesyl diphosphate synthase/geranylgeranyl diphosphate synthase type II